MRHIAALHVDDGKISRNDELKVRISGTRSFKFNANK